MPKAPVHVTIRRIAEIPADDWAEILDFGSGFFEGAFAESIRAKDELVLVRGEDGRLLGMGAVEMFDLVHRGRTVTVIHAGNAAFTDDTRGQSHVQRIGFRYFLRAKRRRPWRPVHLAYTTFSWRSYLMLTRNFVRSWPRRQADLPEWDSGFYESLGRRLLGERFDPAAGVARNLDRRLRSGIAAVPPSLADDADVRFFVAANPGHASGDVLLCIAPLTMANWWSVARRMAGRKRRGRR